MLLCTENIIVKPRSDDKEFIIRLQNKEDDAWRELANRYYQKLLLFCGRYVRTQDEAKDLVHDALFKAMANISKFDLDRYRSIQPWLWQIAKTTTLKYLRYRKVREPNWHAVPITKSTTTVIFLDVMDSRPGPRTAASETDKFRVIFASLEKLDEKFREVLLLHYMDGLTRKQIAELLEIPENTVKSRLRVALQNIRAALPAALDN